MEILVEKTTHEQAGNVLGSIAAANVAEAPKKTPSNVTFRNKTAQAVRRGDGRRIDRDAHQELQAP
jgi:hypothetical protein